MKKALLLTTVLALVFTSCGKYSSEYKKLQAERDSIAAANAKVTSELDEVMLLFDEIEENFKSIKSAENYLSVQSSSTGELTPTVKERIQNDMKFITETLDKNRKQISDLEAKLKSSNLNSAQLSKTLNGLRLELEQKTMALVALKDELEQKNEQIASLSESVNTLSGDVQTLRTQSSLQQEMIKDQQNEINSVFYCFGTSKELKAQKILDGGQVGTDLNRNYFIKENKHTLKVVPLYAKKGKLISKHPDGSYEFGKDANGQEELRILDVNNFWSLTKYLVVQVNM
ncbi:septal ring factor EnvC (AmiA/AmiB activator) [Dysgonomonadaceae bacterium PH5-43]|nr:septal ring factor EnvC (AmiA/AmiB activator) [Dysgonomonadaceae bacterium PH5-43]